MKTRYMTAISTKALVCAGLVSGAFAAFSARKAFGDLKQLDRDLGNYMRRSALEYRKVSGAALQFAPIEGELVL